MDSFSFDSSDSSISYNHYPTRTAQPAPYVSNPHQKSALHSVRKTAPPTKPWRKPTAPLPPNPTRVYQVDRMNFRELVQQLTGASSNAVLPAVNDSHCSRLQKVAPPPLDVAPAVTQTEKSTVLTPFTSFYKELMYESSSLAEASNASHKYSDISLGLGLSPSPQGWCSIPMLSPGTLSLFGM